MSLVSRELDDPLATPLLAGAASVRGGIEEQRLAYVFDLLALALDPVAVRAAHRALSAGNARRGTALEYLETVLPAPIRDALWARLVIAPGVRSG